MLPFNFPKPPTHQDFEMLILTLLRAANEDASVDLYGRNGQSQHGIDVLVDRQDGTFDGYQCKDVKSLSAKVIAKEVKEVKDALEMKVFTGDLTNYVIYTTAARDKNAQNAAQAEARNAPFTVEIRSWERISEEMMMNARVAQSYMLSLPLREESEIYVGQLRVVFDRPAFTDSIAMEMSYLEQLEAVKGVTAFFATGRLHDRNGALIQSSLPATAVGNEQEEIAVIRRLLNDMKSEVTFLVKAEKAGDYVAANRRRDLVDVCRIALLERVNVLLRDYKEPAIPVNR